MAWATQSVEEHWRIGCSGDLSRRQPEFPEADGRTRIATHRAALEAALNARDINAHHRLDSTRGSNRCLGSHAATLNHEHSTREDTIQMSMMMGALSHSHDAGRTRNDPAAGQQYSIAQSGSEYRDGDCTVNHAISEQDSVPQGKMKSTTSRHMPKRCSVDGCNKIAVSKHLCRGHGGGRRCEYPGCTKCAQSRSSFCWAHGGGKRCEAPGCMRSRKTKRFCVDHVQLEQEVAVAVAPLDLSVRTQQEPAIRNERLHRDDSEHEVRAPTISVMCNLPATQLLPSLRVALERFQDDQPRLSPPEALLPDLSRLLARRQSNSLD